MSMMNEVEFKDKYSVKTFVIVGNFIKSLGSFLGRHPELDGERVSYSEVDRMLKQIRYSCKEKD